MREAAGADFEYTQADGAACYVHLSPEARADRDRPQPEQRPAKPDKPPGPILAPTWRRDRVYQALLNSLPLAGRHADDLERRGLSDTEIARNLYATVPDTRTAAELVKAMAAEQDLAGVPGFYRDDHGWRLNVSDWFSGFFIPVRDVDGCIQALKIRRDNGDGPKYVWLTSADKRDGISPGAPLHIARPWHAVSSGELLITEGPLKADIAAEQIPCTAIALPGAASIPNEFGAWVHKTFPDFKTAHIALDIDWKINSHVRRGLLKLIDEMESAGIAATVLNWSGGKGLDDFLTAREVEK